METDAGDRRNSGLWGFWTNMIGMASSEVPSPRTHHPNATRHEDASQWDILDNDDSSVLGVVLSVWDNISGPRVERAWRSPTTSRAIIDQCPTFSLSGELLDSHDLHLAADRLEYKLVILPTHVATCLIFCAPYHRQLSRYALALLFEPVMVPLCGPLQPVLHDRLLQLVELYRSACTTDAPSPSCVLDSLVPHVVHGMRGLVVAPPAPVPVARTLLAHSLRGEEHALLVLAVTALLQCGACVVLGPDETRVTLWLRTLVHWLLPAQRRNAVLRVQASFVPDLVLQGLLTPSLDDEMLIQSLSPIALLDVGVGQVRVTPPCHEYAVLRREYLLQRRRRLLHALTPGVDLREDAGRWGTEALLRPCAPSALVAALIARVLAAPPSPAFLRAHALVAAWSSLEQRALALIAQAKALLQEAEEHRRRLTTSRRGSVRTMSPSQSRHTSLRYSHASVHDEAEEGDEGVLDPRDAKRRIREALQLGEACFYALLGLAERMEPGIYASVAGNPVWTEQKLVRLSGLVALTAQIQLFEGEF